MLYDGISLITLCNIEPIKLFAFVNLTSYYVHYGQFQRVDRRQVQATQVYVVLLSWLIDTGAAAEPAEQGHKAAKQAIQIRRARLRDYSVGIAGEC